ncbi:AAA family ATPase [Acinetobacter sp.]|uniref:AAA family ATPase n=1 Tax=Acinetobacter sp. TaxID=472 RepID=UPI0026187694|nr:AAA family ATPase [uncultured Acinetobacter sp.]
MKLKKVKFDECGFRNLFEIELDIASRLTVIAGHNGIGKSTILGLIANGSELKEPKTLFNKAFRSDFNEVFFLDYHSDFFSRFGGASRAILVYEQDNVEVIKECTVSGAQRAPIKKVNFQKFMVKVDNSLLTEKQQEQLTDDNIFIQRMRVIPRTKNKLDREFVERNDLGVAAKIKIPTLYLGMSRISPIGEFNWEQIEQKKFSKISERSSRFIYDFFNAVIPFKANSQDLYSHTFANNNKQSLVPEFDHSSLSISLGQDSLSSIATAVASFYNLKDVMGDSYRGGILVIDEVEAGLHPIAQRKLIDQLKKYAEQLSLQIIVTSHSLTVIKESFTNGDKDTVIYLTDISIPRVMSEPTYLKIKNDMLLIPFNERNAQQKPIPEIYVYFEDEEAHDLLIGILSSLDITDTYNTFGKKFIYVPAELGCSNLLKLSSKSDHFKESLIILDSDVFEGANNSIKEELKKNKNVILLPVNSEESLFNGLPPDKIAYYFLHQKSENAKDNMGFWKNKVPDFYTNDYYRNYVEPLENSGQKPSISTLDDLQKMNRKIIKRWYKKNKECLNEIGVFKLWALENVDVCKEFVENLAKVIDEISMNRVSGQM